jgi:hypothetical protein
MDALRFIGAVTREVRAVEKDGRPARVVVAACSYDGGAQLRLEHTVPVDEHWNQYGPGATGVGWDLMLLGLSRHVTGHAMPKKLPDMKDVFRASSEAWRRAAIEAGESEEAARAAAERTTKFYAGV